MASPSARSFAAALRRLPKPGPSRLRFLKAHYVAPGRALTMRRLAEAAGYKSYRGVNLWYGKLAHAVGNEMRRKSISLGLLVEFARPRTLTNTEWVLVMRPEFAKALKSAGWLN